MEVLIHLSRAVVALQSSCDCERLKARNSRALRRICAELESIVDDTRAAHRADGSPVKG